MHVEQRTPKTKCAVRTEVRRYTPDQHQQHKWAALVWRGWLTSSLIIGQMPIPTLRNETHPPQRANYQSQPLRSQQEMTSGIHVICKSLSGEISFTPNQMQTPVKEQSGRDSSKWNLIRAAKQHVCECSPSSTWLRPLRARLCDLFFFKEYHRPVLTCWFLGHGKAGSRQLSGCLAFADFVSETAEHGKGSPI